MSIDIQPGSTDVSVRLSIIDSGDGTPETGVVYNSSGIDLKYRRTGAAAVSITEANLATPTLTDPHLDGGFLAIGNGSYRLDLPDDAVAIGADECEVFGTVTGMIVLPLTINLREPGRSHAGVAQGGGLQSVTLASTADGTYDDRYNGHVVRLKHAGPVASPGLAIDATPEAFKITNTFGFRYGGLTYSKAAATGITFTAAHVITASKFGVILVQVSTAGTVSTKVPTSPQAYDDAATALTNLPEPDSGNVRVGYIAIENNVGDWTANTDDLTDASDVTTAAFTSYSHGGLEEWNDVADYTASSRAASLGRELAVKSDVGDEVYLYGAPFPPTVTEQQAGLATSSSLTSVTDKLPSKTYLAGSDNADGDVELDDATGVIPAAALANVFTTAMTEAYSTDGGTKTLAQALYELNAMMQEKSISSTTMTVKKVDGSTTAMTFTLDDATDPTSITRSG